MAIKFDTFKTSTAAASDVTSVNGEQGDVIVTLDSATDQGATTTNSITVGGLSVGTAYSLPTSDGTANQSLITDGSGNLSFTTLDFTGGLEYKGTFNATAGTPSLANAEQGDYYKVDTAGTIYGQTWAVGDSLLINADMGGTITNSKIDKIDNTESVTSVNSQTGAVNLGAGDLSDVTITSAANGEVLKYNGSAWVDANVDYTEITNTPTNVSTFTNDANYVTSGDNVSVLTNDTGYLTDITAESLNDLSDVSFTAGVGIDGHVLTYDNTAGEWQAVAPASGGLSAVVEDTTPQLGGALDVNGQEITSASNGNVVINPNGTGEITIGADVVPDADATHTIGSESNRYISTYSDLNGAIRFKAKNNQGSAITKGQAVYISGVSGTIPEVKLAQANSALTMPAFGLALNNANDQAEIQIITFGNLTDYNTTTYSLSANDTVYVSATTAGALTNSAPAGESNLIQNIGRVVRADASAGIIKVGGAGRSNATPNLDQNKIFLGNASNQSVSTALSSIALSSFNDDLSYLSSGDNVSTLTNDAGYLTGITGESIGSLSDVTVTSATSGEVLKYNGSAWVDASVDYTEITNTPTNVSTFTNDSGYLTGITGESLGDLSDVTVTTPSNGQVLSYNGTNWVNSASSAGSLSGLSDTTISSPTSGEVLSYNGTAWVNDTVTSNEYTVVNKTSANFTASSGDFYYVNTVSGTTTIVSLPARTYALATEKIKFFNHGTGVLRVQETTGTGAIHPDESGNDPSGSGTSYKEIASRCIIEFLGIQNTFNWEWAISAQLELGKDTLSADGEVLRYDSSSDQMTALPYTFPTADGSANQILKTDGAGALTFIDQPNGTAPDVVTDSSGTDTTISTYTGIEEVHLISNGANNVTITLPTASTVGEGYKYQIKRLGTGTVTVTPASGFIDVSGTTTFSLASQFDSVTLVSDNSNYYII